MKLRTAQASPLLVALACAVTGASSFSAEATNITLSAAPVTVTMPGTGEVVTMWGYGLNGGPATVPGAPIVVRPTDLPLTVTLTNGLPEPTSLVVSGQPLPSSGSPGPVWIDASGGVSATGSRPAGDVTSRVRSFVGEAAPNGGTQTYTFTTLAAGTYQYGTGTHPGVQHQMGLHGPLVVLPAAGQAYPGVAYDKEVTIVVSEVDPRSHAAISGSGTFAPLPLAGQTPRLPPPGGNTPGPATASAPDTSPVEYYPKYFLVNGAPYAPGSTIGSGLTSGNPQVSAALNVGDTVLVRFVNSGLKNHSLQILSPVPGSAPAAVPAPYLRLIAEDGNPYPYPRDRYSVFLPPGKTVDALFVASGAGNYPIQDRALALTTSTLVGDSGLQAVLAITGSATAPSAAGDSYSIAGNTATTIPANVLTVAAPGVLANDTNPTANPLTAALVSTTSHGTLALAADGSFTYTPATGFAGVDSFTYRASNGTSGNVATVAITVGLPPSAGNDSYSVVAGQTLTVSAPGVLANDSSPAALPLTAVLGTGPLAGTLTLNANGSFTYVAPAVAGPQTFTYTASDGSLSSAAATVSINVTAPQPPVANADSYTTTASLTSAGGLSVAAPGVLGNDSSPNGLPLTAVLGTTTTKGTLTLSANGSFTYWTTNASATTDSFTYRASDGTLQSAPATVTINITAHPAPVARDDTFSAGRRTTTTYTPVNLNVLANDTATAPATLPNLASTVTILSQPSRGGTVTKLANGTINYTPARNFRGSDVFTYRVKDTLNSNSNTARVTVNVQ